LSWVYANVYTELHRTNSKGTTPMATEIAGTVPAAVI
jgi:hypothetical protein